MVNERDLVRDYLSYRIALARIARENTKGLNENALEYLLLIGNYPNETITEGGLVNLFCDSASSVSDAVKHLTDASLTKKEKGQTGHLRRGNLILTKEGEKVYKTVCEKLKSAAEENLFPKPIF